MFAVGVTAYELLVGELPFGNYQSDPTGYLDRLGRGEWNRQRLNAVAPGPVLIRVIDKILRPRANQRFRKLAQFRAALGCI